MVPRPLDLTAAELGPHTNCAFPVLTRLAGQQLLESLFPSLDEPCGKQQSSERLRSIVMRVKVGRRHTPHSGAPHSLPVSAVYVL